MNAQVNAMAVAATTLQPCDETLQDKCKMEVVFRPSVPNNFDHWYIFHGDAQILRCFDNMQESLLAILIGKGKMTQFASSQSCNQRKIKFLEVISHWKKYLTGMTCSRSHVNKVSLKIVLILTLDQKEAQKPKANPDWKGL
jgi:hypothetical protein